MLEKNLEQIDEEELDLLDVLSAGTIELILQIAHEKIIQKPQCITQSL